MPLDKLRGRGCGNINGLRPEDIVWLDPNQQVDLNEYCDLQAPMQPGRYKVRLAYTNKSGLQWQGIGNHDPGAMVLVQESTDCTLISNEVIVTVRK